MYSSHVSHAVVLPRKTRKASLCSANIVIANNTAKIAKLMDTIKSLVIVCVLGRYAAFNNEKTEIVANF